MPAYKDEQTKGKWYCKFYYQNHSGEKKVKKKRGFKTKKEALAYEENFLNQFAETDDSKFKDLFQLYLNDSKARNKYSTWHHTEWVFEKFFLPRFGDKKANEITPKEIRMLQNDLLNYKQDNGKSYSQTYIKRLEKELSGFFNYLVKFYGLKANPVQIAGSVGSTIPEVEMKIWTEEEFLKAIEYEKDPDYHLAYNTMFYGGLRIGELRALTWDDIDFENSSVNINKNLQYTEVGEDFTTTKTKESNRIVYLDEVLMNELQSYKNAQYEPSGTDLLFHHAKTSYGIELHKLAEKAQLEHIRVHDLRHSHVSYLINLGANIVLISKRLGHKSIKMTLDKYSHLYPDESKEIALSITQHRISNAR